MRFLAAVIAGTAALSAGFAARAAEAWTVDGRCVAQVCVGDTVHSLRRAAGSAGVLRAQGGGFAWLQDGQPVLRVELEDGPEPPSDASRIALIEVMRPGTRAGLGQAVIGGPFQALQAAGPGQWLDPPGAARGGKARWWSVALPSPPGRQAYPLSFSVDGGGRIASALLNGGNQLEAAYPDLATALQATQARLRALQPALAWLPLQPPALPRGGAVYADLVLSARALALRITSRPDCDSASCQIMSVDIGAEAADDSATEALALADGSPARLRPTRCGGSCSPAAVVLQRGGQPLRIEFDTGFAAPKGSPLDPARDRRWLQQLADSVPTQP